MSEQTVSLKLDADATGLKSEVQASGQAMEDLAGKGSQAGEQIEASVHGASSAWEEHSDTINAAAVAMGAAGAAFEGFARGQQDTNATLSRTAIAIGETEESLRDSAVAMSDHTFATSDAIDGMERLAQAGIETKGEFEAILPAVDDLSDATGRGLVESIDTAERLLGPFGQGIADVAENSDQMARIITQTDIPLGTLERNLGRIPDELQDLKFGLDEASAGIEVFRDRGYSGQESVREFRRAVADSEGDMGQFLDILGLTAEQWEHYQQAVEPIPGLTQQLAEANNDAATPLQNLQQRVENLMVEYGGLAEAAGMLSPVLLGAGGVVFGINQVIEAKGHMIASSGRAVGALRGVTTFLTGPWGIALAAATIGVGLFIKSKREAEQRVSELQATLDAQTGALTDNTEALAVNRLQQDGAITAARDLGISMETLVGAALGVPGAMDDVDDAINRALAAPDSRFGAEEAIHTLTGSLPPLRSELEQATVSAREEAEAMAELEGRYVDVGHALDSGLNPAEAHHAILMQESAAAAGEVEGAVSDAGDAYEDTAGQTLTAAEAIDEYIAANRRATDPVFRLMDAIEKVDAAQDAYNDTLDENGDVTDESAEAAINLMQRLGDLEAAALDGDVSFAEFAAQLDRWVDQGLITETQAGLIRERVAEASAAADEFEGTRNMVVNASGNAWDRLSSLNAQIAALPRNVAIRAQGGVEFRADGGPVEPGQPYIVGEEGPELVTFGQRGMVHDADTTSRLMAGSASGIDNHLLERLVSHLEHREAGTQFVSNQTFAGDVSRETLAEARHQQRIAFLEAV